MRPALYAGAALLALMAVGGMLSSVAYNAALGRAAYQSDTFVQKFGWGAQALFLPIVLTCLAAGLAGAIVAVRRVLVAASTRVRALDRRVEDRGRSHRRPPDADRSRRLHVVAAAGHDGVRRRPSGSTGRRCCSP